MPPAKPHHPSSPCPCCSGKSLGECCLPYLKSDALPTTAEALMRSRYTAHVLVDIDYLWATWSPDIRTGSSRADIRAWAESCEWLGLEILATEAGGKGDRAGIVSFVAHVRKDGQLQEHREVSMFTQSKRGWRYLHHQN